MNELLALILALVAGILLGTFFFGGLWYTIKKGVVSQQPVFWFFGSLIIRMGVTMTGFYVIARDHWERAVVCLAGFLIARAIITRFTRISPTNQIYLAKEVDHEN